MIAAIDADKSVGQQESSSTQPIEMRFNEMLEGSRADVTMRIYGTDLDKLAEMTTKGKQILEKVKGVESVQSDPIIALSKSPVLDIELNYDAISYCRLDPRLRNDVAQIRNIPVGLESGGSVPLYKVATINERDQVSTIARSQGRRYAALSINLGDIDVESFVRTA